MSEAVCNWKIIEDFCVPRFISMDQCCFVSFFFLSFYFYFYITVDLFSHFTACISLASIRTPRKRCSFLVFFAFTRRLNVI